MYIFRNECFSPEEIRHIYERKHLWTSKSWLRKNVVITLPTRLSAHKRKKEWSRIIHVKTCRDYETNSISPIFREIFKS